MAHQHNDHGTAENSVSLAYSNQFKVFKVLKFLVMDQDRAFGLIDEVKATIGKKVLALIKQVPGRRFLIFEDVLWLGVVYAKKSGICLVPLVFGRFAKIKKHCIQIGYDPKGFFFISKIESERRLTPEEFLNSLKIELKVHLEQLRKLFPYSGFKFLQSDILEGLQHARFRAEQIKNLKVAECRFDLDSPVEYENAAKMEFPDVTLHRLLGDEPADAVVRNVQKKITIAGSYEFKYRKDTFTLQVVVKKLDPYRDKTCIEDLVNKIKHQGKELVARGEGGNYKIKVNEIVAIIEGALASSAAEINFDGLVGEANAEAELDMALSMDNMVLYLNKFSQAKGSVKRIEVSDFIREAKALNVNVNLDKMKVSCERALKLAENGEGLPPEFILCKGEHSVDGKNGEIDYIYRRKKHKLAEDKDGRVDFRKRSSNDIVLKGQPIIRIIDPIPGKSGINLLGEELPVNNGVAVDVTPGDGVRFDEKRKVFYAEYEGMPLLENQILKVNSSYMVNGDVNFKTGDINFDGNVIVKGNVEGGAHVEATRDVSVEGYIQNGSVTAGGKIVVGKGIKTGKNREVRSRVEITSEYIENSTVVCFGSVNVRQSIVNSEVSAGGLVNCKEGRGVLVGGIVKCKGLECIDLGIGEGNLTKVFAGIDFRYENELEVNRAKLDKVKGLLEERRKEEKSVKRNPSLQIGYISKEDKLAELAVLIDELTPEVEDLEYKIDMLIQNKPLPPSGFVVVHGTMSSNIGLKVNGMKAITSKELMSVAYRYQVNTKKLEMMALEGLDISSIVGVSETPDEEQAPGSFPDND